MKNIRTSAALTPTAAILSALAALTCAAYPGASAPPLGHWG